MDITEHAYAGIISLTQYEIANRRNNTESAAAYLAETMRHVIAIMKLSPAKEGARLPGRFDNPIRLCMYMRCIDALTAIIAIPELCGASQGLGNHIGCAWVECRRLAEYHGWMLPEMQLAALVPVDNRGMVKIR